MTAMTYLENINLKLMPRVVRLVALLVALQTGHCNALWANRYFAQPKLKRADTLICNGVIPIVGFSLFFFFLMNMQTDLIRSLLHRFWMER